MKCRVTTLAKIVSGRVFHDHAHHVLDPACLTEGRRRQGAASLLSPQRPSATFFP
jgi:hypothetical protein